MPRDPSITQAELDALCREDERPSYPLDDLTPDDEELILSRRTL